MISTVESVRAASDYLRKYNRDGSVVIGMERHHISWFEDLEKRKNDDMVKEWKAKIKLFPLKK